MQIEVDEYAASGGMKAAQAAFVELGRVASSNTLPNTAPENKQLLRNNFTRFAQLVLPRLPRGPKLRPGMDKVSTPAYRQQNDKLEHVARMMRLANLKHNATAPGYAKRCVKLKKLRSRVRKQVRRAMRREVQNAIIDATPAAAA